MSKAIEFKDVTKRFDGAEQDAVDRISFCAEAGEIVTIIGTSGSGKTTLLKMINRLYDPTSGSILIRGEDIRTKDPVILRRGIGYVIQQIGLFPHMTVRDNIATVPKTLKWDKARIDERVDELLTLVGLDPAAYRKRYPSQLSGGQQQRVGLARALAAYPQIMLLDEPFGALDAITRTKLQDDLLHIHSSGGGTFMFVTHDIAEALKLGSHILIMDAGKIIQYDTPANILSNPATDFVKDLIGL